MKSRFILFKYLLAILVLYSCNGPKKITSTERKPSYKTETTPTRPDQNKSGVDTALVYDPAKNPSNPNEEPVKQEEPARKHKKETIKVVLALPMDGSYDVARFAEFINGINIASESGITGRPKIKVEVINIGNKNTEEELLSKANFTNTDILIGGYQTSQVKMLAKIALEKKIPYLSIWNTSEEIVADNPFYIQLKPSLNSYSNTIAKYVSEQIKPQLVLIMLESKNSKDNVAVEAYKKIYSGKKVNYKVIYMSENNADWANMIGNYSNIVFNIPNWENKNFVGSTLRKINDNKKGKSIIVTGMPQWTEWDQMDFNLYEQLNVHLPIFNYVDLQSMNATIFSETYYAKYNTWPTTESFYGSDILAMVRNISIEMSEGGLFNPNKQVSGHYFSNYQIVNNRIKTLDTNSDVSSYSQNIFITIQKFEGGRFVQIQ